MKKKLTLKPNQKIEIEWMDSIQNMDGWTRLSHFNWGRHYKAMYQRTVGYFLQKTDNVITVTQSISASEDALCGIWSIPLGCVTNIKQLD